MAVYPSEMGKSPLELGKIFIWMRDARLEDGSPGIGDAICSRDFLCLGARFGGVRNAGAERHAERLLDEVCGAFVESGEIDRSSATADEPHQGIGEEYFQEVDTRRWALFFKKEGIGKAEVIKCIL